MTPGGGLLRLKRTPPNPFGLHDMLGNVWEWVTDRYWRRFYENSPTRDPAWLDEGEYRVLRGGSWDSERLSLRLSFRFALSPAGPTRSLHRRAVCPRRSLT